MLSHPEVVENAPGSRRKQFRLSMKWLMILVAVVGVGFGLLGRWYQTYDIIRQRTLVGLIRAPRNVQDLVWKPTEKELLRRAIRIDTNSVMNDLSLAELTTQANPQILSLDGSQVSDAGLAHLGSMSNLRYLDLRSTGITDAGLVPLKNMKGLQEISLKGTKVTRSGLDDLKRALPHARIWEQ